MALLLPSKLRRFSNRWQIPVAITLCTVMLLTLTPFWGCLTEGGLHLNGTSLVCLQNWNPRELAFAIHQQNQRLANHTESLLDTPLLENVTGLMGSAKTEGAKLQGSVGGQNLTGESEKGKSEGDVGGGSSEAGANAGTGSLLTSAAAKVNGSCNSSGESPSPGCLEAGSALEEKANMTAGASEIEGIEEVPGENLKIGSDSESEQKVLGGSENAGENRTEAERVSPHSSCRPNELIYVYDLPSEFHTDLLVRTCATSDFWSQHPRNACVVYSPEFGGIGPRLTGGEVAFLSEIGSPVNSWADTGQFALEIMFHQYLLESYPCRTTNGNEAAAFYVPLYTGMLHHNWSLACDSATCPEVSPLGLLGRRLGAQLNKLPYWQRHRGRDHITTMGHVSHDALHEDTCCQNGLLKTKHTKNFVIMSIESSFLTESERQVSVPYPTCFHPGTPEEITAHQNLAQSSNRTVLVSFAGQLTRPGLFWGRNLRQKIAEQFALHPGDCELVECGMECPCTKVLGAQLRAKFCLQPTGDSPTRRSLFDSLQAGCIPVLFHRASAYDEYTSFLPANESSYSVFIPESDVMTGGVDIIEELRRIPEAELERKRAVIASMVASISYEDHGKTRAIVESAERPLDDAGRNPKPRNPLGEQSAYEKALTEALRRVERAVAKESSTLESQVPS